MAAKKRAKRATRKAAARSGRPKRSHPKRTKSTTGRRARARKAAPRPRPKPRTARPATAPRAAATVASAIGVTHQHMDYTSHALEDVKRFYGEVLGFRDLQVDGDFQYMTVRTGPSSSLGFMPPMPGPPEQWRPPREPVIYLYVQDVDRAHRDLVAKGVTFLQEPTDMPWKHRVAILRDPEGRAVALAQVIQG